MILKKEITADTDAIVWIIENKARLAQFLFPITEVILCEGEPESRKEECRTRYSDTADKNPSVSVFVPICYTQPLGYIDVILEKRDLFVGETGISWNDDGCSANTATIMVPEPRCPARRILAEAELYRAYHRKYTKKFIIVSDTISRPPDGFELFRPMSFKG